MPADHRLLTLPFSHYCEKARWALDHVGISYVEEGYNPGFHILPVWRAGGKRTVPVLVTPMGVWADSTDILHYAHQQADSQHALFSKDPAVNGRILFLEELFDVQIGPHLRRVFYASMLPHPERMEPFFKSHVPAWQYHLTKPLYPVIRHQIEKALHIRPAKVRMSDHILRETLAWISGWLQPEQFLCGATLSAADITLASLLAHAAWPPEHPILGDQKMTYTPELMALIAELEQYRVLEWVRWIYHGYRARL